MPQSLAGYPPWLVILCATLVAGIALWILGRVLRLALGILMIAVLVGGTAYAVWTLLKG